MSLRYIVTIRVGSQRVSRKLKVPLSEDPMVDGRAIMDEISSMEEGQFVAMVSVLDRDKARQEYQDLVMGGTKKSFIGDKKKG
jgi:hypothetical protein